MWFKNRLVGAIAFVLGACLVGIPGYYFGHRNGVSEGIDSYHNQCYNVGGLIIGEDGRVVQCAPLVQIPREEAKKLRRPLDNV